MLTVPEDDGDKILVAEDGVVEHESVTEDLVAEDDCLLPNFPHFPNFPKSLVCSAFCSCWSESGDG